MARNVDVEHQCSLTIVNDKFEILNLNCFFLYSTCRKDFFKYSPLAGLHLEVRANLVLEHPHRVPNFGAPNGYPKRGAILQLTKLTRGLPERPNQCPLPQLT